MVTKLLKNIRLVLIELLKH